MADQSVVLAGRDAPMKVALQDAAVRERNLRFMDYVERMGAFRNAAKNELSYLRSLKFNNYDEEKAAAMMIKLANVIKNLPQYYRSMDINDPILYNLTRKGFIFKLPETHEGSHVFMHYPRVLAGPEEGHGNHLKSIALSITSALNDPDVDSVTMILDYEGCGLHLLAFAPIHDTKIFGLSAVKSTPVNFTAFHVVNVPSWAGWVLRVALSFATRTIRHKIFIHKDWDSLKRVVPARILPKEYGGTIPQADMIDDWINVLKSHRDDVLQLDEFQIAPAYRTKTYGYGGHDSEEIKSSKHKHCHSSPMSALNHLSKLQID